jgi:hypothetical protein
MKNNAAINSTALPRNIFFLALILALLLKYPAEQG